MPAGLRARRRARDASSPCPAPRPRSRSTTSSPSAEASSNLARYDGVRYGAARDPTRASPRSTSRRGRGASGAEVKRRILLGTFALSSGYYEAYYGRAMRARRAPGAGLRAGLRGGGRHRVPVDSGAGVPARREGGRSAPDVPFRHLHGPGLARGASGDLGPVGPVAGGSAARPPDPGAPVRRGDASSPRPARFEREIGFPRGARRRRRVRTRRSRAPAAAPAPGAPGRRAARRPAAPAPRPAREDRSSSLRRSAYRRRKATRSFLSARPLPGEGVDAFVKRLTDDPERPKEILGAETRRAALRRDVFFRVPYARLSPTYRKIAIEALFPDDTRRRRRVDARRHGSGRARPRASGASPSGSRATGAKYREIREAGAIASLETEKGQLVRIPARLLLPVFRERRRGRVRRSRPALEFGRGRAGPVRASTGCRRGEALYSAVVVRFTGRVHAEDVNAKAVEIAARSGIADVRSIPVGFPGEDPRRRPRARSSGRPDDPERIEEETARLETAQFVNRVRAADLSGVTFVLDAGHGGRDTGAIVEGIEEARASLRSRVPRRDAAQAAHEGARRAHGARRRALLDRGVRRPRRRTGARARVMTTPPYDLEDAVAGVNFRWYLANAVLRRVEKDGGSEDRTVFVSLHADSLHPGGPRPDGLHPRRKVPAGNLRQDGRALRVAPRGARGAAASPSRARSGSRRRACRGTSRSRSWRPSAPANLPLHDFQPIRRNVIRGRPGVGAGHPPLQPHPDARARRGLQPEQPGRPQAARHARVSGPGGARSRLGARGLLRRRRQGAAGPASARARLTGRRSAGRRTASASAAAGRFVQERHPGRVGRDRQERRVGAQGFAVEELGRNLSQRGHGAGAVGGPRPYAGLELRSAGAPADQLPRLANRLEGLLRRTQVRLDDGGESQRVGIGSRGGGVAVEKVAGLRVPSRGERVERELARRARSGRRGVQGREEFPGRGGAVAALARREARARTAPVPAVRRPPRRAAPERIRLGETSFPLRFARETDPALPRAPAGSCRPSGTAPPGRGAPPESRRFRRGAPARRPSGRRRARSRGRRRRKRRRRTTSAITASPSSRGSASRRA